MADEPIKFPEKRSQISRMVDLIGEELKNMQGYRNVGPDQSRLIEIFGGRKIPSKFTFAQMRELIKDMSPLADTENNAFTLSQLIEEKYPGTIDKEDFDRVDKEIGTTMDLQAKGNLIEPPANESMPSKKDPTQITLREAADAYNARGAGKIARFGAKGALKQYGDIPLVQAFTPDENGVRLIDTMLDSMTSQGAANSLQDDLRLISKDVNRKIFNADPNSSALNLLPGLEADDPQTFNIFGERVSAPRQTEIAIIAQNKQGWGEFMQQLDAIRQGGGDDAVIADAIYVNLQTGYRAGAVSGLTGAEYKVDRGTVEITPQTKATPELEKRTGAQKVGGKRGKAIPQDVPLNEQAHARLQQRLAANQEDAGVRAFIEDKIKAGKAAPIFVIKGKGGKYRQVNTEDMTEVLSRIKTSTPIIKDNITNKEFNTLVPDDPAYSGKDKKGKFGSALLRNVFANVAAFEVEMSDKMLDFLQGRSLTSGAETRSKTAKSGYLVRPRGTFYPGERDAAQSVGNWFDQVEGVDVSQRFNPETETIRGAKYNIPGMFDQPAPEVTAPAPVDEPKLQATEIDVEEKPSDKLASKLEKFGINIDAVDVDTTAKGVAGAAILSTIATTSDAAQAASEIGRDVALDAAAETALKGAIGRTAAGRIPLADIVIATEAGRGSAFTGPGSIEELRAQAKMAEEARERDAVAEAAMQEGDSFLTMQP